MDPGSRKQSPSEFRRIPGAPDCPKKLLFMVRPQSGHYYRLQGRYYLHTSGPEVAMMYILGAWDCKGQKP